MHMTVYVPRPGSHAAVTVWRRSAIVGEPHTAAPGERVLCHYEGGKHLHSFRGKLRQAGFRALEGYPTASKAAFKTSDLLPVGTYDAERGVILELLDPDALTSWSGEPLQYLVGPKLECGLVEWDEAAKVVSDIESRFIGATRSAVPGMWYKTVAGQIIRFEGGKTHAEVFEFNDPQLIDRLSELDLSADQAQSLLPHVLGSALAAEYMAANHVLEANQASPDARRGR